MRSLSSAAVALKRHRSYIAASVVVMLHRRFHHGCRVLHRRIRRHRRCCNGVRPGLQWSTMGGRWSFVAIAMELCRSFNGARQRLQWSTAGVVRARAAAIELRRSFNGACQGLQWSAAEDIGARRGCNGAPPGSLELVAAAMELSPELFFVLPCRVQIPAGCRGGPSASANNVAARRGRR
ncbi:hypothetical protein VPH35_039999 [Triticum aestivum]